MNDNKAIDVIVSGGSGLVGKNLITLLQSRGYRVFNVDIADGYDITKKSDMDSLPSAKHFVHLAAKIHIPAAQKNPYPFYDVNINGTHNALEYCKKHGSHMIYVSSYLYGEPQYLPIDEQHPVSILNPYAGSKYLAEELCKQYQRFFHVPVHILRPFNIYGEGQVVEFLIPSIINQIPNERVAVHTLKHRRDFVHAKDVGRAIEKCLSIESTFDIFNIGSGISHSVEDVLQIVQKYSQKHFEVYVSQSDRINEIVDCQANIQKATHILSWHPTVSLEEGIKSMLAESGLLKTN